jgi:hypothetical protein
VPNGFASVGAPAARKKSSCGIFDTWAACEAAGGRQLQQPGRAAADSFGDDNPVTLGIRDHALVVSVARPPWPIEKRVSVALQSFCKGVDGGPRAHSTPRCAYPMNSRELCESGILWMSGRCISSNRPPPGNVRKYEVNLLRSFSYFRFRPRAEVLLVEGAHQFDVHSPDCDVVKLHCVQLS